jgi:hypothetical protein
LKRRSLLFAAAALGAAQDGGTLSLDALSWVAGRWQGQLPWGMIEEIWSPASNGVMMGMFRMETRGKASLYEFMTLSQTASGVSLKIRHFNGAFAAREEKDKSVDFALTAAKGPEFTFFVDEGAAKVTLVYRKTGADSMEVDFKKVPVEGKTEEIRFPYRRAAL